MKGDPVDFGLVQIKTMEVEQIKDVYKRQHVGYVGIAQQIHVSTHREPVKRPLHRGMQVDEHLSIHQTFARCV